MPNRPLKKGGMKKELIKTPLKNKQDKKKPRFKGRILKSSGKARPAEKTPIVNPGSKKKKKKGSRIKIVPGFKSLIDKHQERIRKATGG